MGDETPIVLSPKAILKGLEAFVYQFDGYSEDAKGWAKDGYRLFLMGAEGAFDHDYRDADEEDE